MVKVNQKNDSWAKNPILHN